jgi:hypothetical protein
MFRVIPFDSPLLDIVLPSTLQQGVPCLNLFLDFLGLCLVHHSVQSACRDMRCTEFPNWARVMWPHARLDFSRSRPFPGFLATQHRYTRVDYLKYII